MKLIDKFDEVKKLFKYLKEFEQYEGTIMFQGNVILGKQIIIGEAEIYVKQSTCFTTIFDAEGEAEYTEQDWQEYLKELRSWFKLYKEVAW